MGPLKVEELAAVPEVLEELVVEPEAALVAEPLVEMAVAPENNNFSEILNMFCFKGLIVCLEVCSKN